jgi:endonuclease-8
MPEGDTIAYAAQRIRPVLEGHVPDEIRTPQPSRLLDRWPAAYAARSPSGLAQWAAAASSGCLDGRAVTEIRTHGKHLFIRFGRADGMSSGGSDGDLTLHSHLRMTGSWGVYEPGHRWRRSPHRAWLVLARAGHEVVQFDGPVLELLTESRTRFDQRLTALGPDILAPEFDHERFLARLRADDYTRGIGDALLDQRNLAGIGNLWKSEGCWEMSIDPWRKVKEISDAEAVAIVDALRPRMFESARTGDQGAHRRVFRQNGRPCPRCGTRIQARGQGDENRTTFWCPGCQR